MLITENRSLVYKVLSSIEGCEHLLAALSMLRSNTKHSLSEVGITTKIRGYWYIVQFLVNGRVKTSQQCAG